MATQLRGSRRIGIATRRFARAGLLRQGNRRGQRGTILFMVMAAMVLGVMTALVLGRIVLEPRLLAEYGVHRSAAFAAATAGLEQSKLVVGHSTIFTDANHPSFSFNGTLNNETYSVSVVWTGGMNVLITSTGRSGASTCVLTRGCLAMPDSSKLALINYANTDTTKFTNDLTFMPNRGPRHLGPVELPDFNYWRNLAKSQGAGHYFSGDVTLGPGASLNGVYFSEGNMTVKNTQLAPGASVTLVCVGDMELQGPNNLLNSPDWTEPVIVAGGNIDEKSGASDLTGAVYAGGDFLIQNGGITGRVEANNFTQSNGTLTDNANPLVYQFLNGFTYNPAVAGWLLTYSGWSEAWQ